jgi:TetR/AcrR family transcriptional regulator
METRAKILHEALKLFASYGYDAVGVQVIVEAAGITKPTLYHHFGSKRGLFEILVAEHSTPLIEMVQKATAYKGDITLSIQTVVQTYFDFAENNTTFYRMMLSTWFAPPSSEYFASVQGVLVQQHLLLEEMFRNAVQNHGNMAGRHQQYAVSLKGIIDTYIGMALQGYINLQTDNLKYRIVHQFMHGIFS